MVRFNTPAYDVERPTGHCALTGQQLAVGDPYMATLIEVEPPSDRDQDRRQGDDLGLKRVDVAWEAWQEGRRPEKLFCYWKGRVAEPNQKKRIFVDDAVLMNLFRRLADEDQPSRIAFRFVLGLILMRKKCLRYDDTKQRQIRNENGEMIDERLWQVTPKLDLTKGPLGKWNENDPLEMLDPRLSEEQVQQVTEQLGQVLDADLNEG